MEPLKLIALDKDDLEVVSTHLQDALLSVADIVWLPSSKRLVLALSRFDWESVACGNPQYQRRRTALRFERVNSFKAQKIKPADKAVMLNLLAVEFSETDSPAGSVTLTFSGGAMLKLEVECLEAELSDLGPAWTTTLVPGHPEDTAQSSG